ncbi:energy-coupling factor ABC transporter ATP-binding protein [Radiobacillus kanasensis]|uniref:energy-coupling factor ABC transporter ATP-binding protein n=1 Tax=Radiobacillus kanasensis TaxID=2844358 RepID=UPI001E651C44|nr:energy-coupling factor ABC transporter ATP-binding protein [Radiobacillus kanasensis]UFT99524.1 energy-coupling factor ABC transporter ATP-binding protein [Radiobacillus kanasensis]
MERAFIEFHNVSFRYGEDQPWALRGVSFQIHKNESVVILGHNGSGKSTIAKLMNGLLFPQEGEIYVAGMPVNEETIWDVRSHVGMVFQNPDNQFVGTTVRDDVAFGLENRGIKREEMLRRIERSLSSVGMESYSLHEPHRLSGGQKQRVAIASVLAIFPDVMILDEATAMLDPKGRKQIHKTIQSVMEDNNLSLVTITHDLSEAIHTDRILVMNAGKVWAEGLPRDIFTKKKELEEIGLDVPFISKLADELQHIDIPIRHEPLNEEELLEELWIYHSSK